MRVYVDSSALLKRVFEEPESQALLTTVRGWLEDGAVLMTSSLAWIEVSRAVRAADPQGRDVDDVVDVALSGLLEKPVSADVVALARRLSPSSLRSLDAVHLASALMLDADVLLAYDRRLLDAAAEHRLRTLSPAP